MKSDVLILAGGKSRRMGGRHKGNLITGTETFQRRLIRELSRMNAQIFLSYGLLSQGEYEGCKVLMDEIPDCGPMGGIVTGLRQVETEVMIVAACDLPYMEASFFEYLYHALETAEEQEHKTYKGIVPVVNGKIHPLTAIYRKTALADFENALSERKLKMTRQVESMDVLFIDLTGVEKFEKMLININTPEEYRSMMESDKR